MRGLFYSSNQDGLSDHDLQELADALACQLHNTIGPHVVRLQRVDVAELLEPYICDLATDEQNAINWMVWHLFQEAREIMMLDDD
jgi:hypothetical protein